MSSIVEGLSEALRGFVTVFVGTLLGRLLAMVGRILIIRALPPNEFGIIVLAFTVVSMVAELAIIGMPQGVARTLADRKSGIEQLNVLKSALLVTSVASVLAAGVVLGARDTIAAVMNEPEMDQLLVVFAGYVVVHPLASTVIGALRGLKQPRGATLASNVSPNTFSLAVFGIFSLLGLAYYGAIAYWLFLPLWTAIVGIWYLRREISLRSLCYGLPSASTTRDLISFSWPLAIQSGITMLMMQVDVLFIGYFRNSGDVGLYKSVLPLAKMTLMFLFSYVFLYLPLATEYYRDGDIQSLKRFYQMSTKWIVAVTFPVALFLALFPSDLIRVLYQSDYLGGSTVLTILSLGLFLRVVAGPNAATIQSIEQTRVDLGSAVLGLVTNIVLNLALVPTYGISGAAVATILGFAAYNAMEIGVMYRSHGLHPFTMNMVKPIILTGIAGVVLAAALQDHGLGLLSLVVIGFALAGIQVVAVFLTGSLNPEDIIVVRQVESATGLDLGFLKAYIPE